MRVPQRGRCEMTATKTVKVEWEVTARLADDIIVTAFDPGYGGALYWAEVDKRHPVGRWADTDDNDRAVEFHPDDEPDRNLRVGYDEIVKGLQLAVENGHMDIAKAVVNDDGGDIDATLADVIVQYATLGELVYG